MRRISKRALDLALVGVAAPLFAIPFAIVATAIKGTSKGPVFHVSERVGLNNQNFRMFKFRTMHVGTPQMATHLIEQADSHLTPIGGLLRRTSLDELPQLLNILKGDMSFVGPRPALYNQDDLVALRNERGVDELIPGLTGWAQVNGRDDIPIPRKVELDAWYLENESLALDLRILAATVWKALYGEGVQH